MNIKKTTEELAADQKRLEKLRKSLNKTIDDFKQSVLEGITKYEDGPLKESLRLDREEEVPEVANPQAETLEEWVTRIFVQPAQETEQSIPLIKPLAEERTTVIPASEVEQWVSEEAAAPDAQMEKPQNPQASNWQAAGEHVFFVGIDNAINSTIRQFFQKMGMRTHLPALESFKQQSIVEQFAFYNDFSFAVVVLSPDQYMFQKRQDPSQALLITDQETVFELGYLVGRLGRNRVAVIYEESNKFKRPTEYFDVLYTAYDSEGAWQQKIIRQMQTCGIVLHDKQISKI